MTDWFSSSYMARKGVASGKAGRTHALTEGRAGRIQICLRRL